MKFQWELLRGTFNFIVRWEHSMGTSNYNFEWDLPMSTWSEKFSMATFNGNLHLIGFEI